VKWGTFQFELQIPELSKRGKWYGNLIRKIPEFLIFEMKIKWSKYSRAEIFKNCVRNCLEVKATSDCYSYNTCFSVKENLTVINVSGPANVIVAGDSSKNTITPG